MRYFVASIALFVYFGLVPSVQAQEHTIQPTDNIFTLTLPLDKQTANNTSSCDSVNSPPYCTIPLPNLNTSTANQNAGAQTIVADAFPVHASIIKMNQLMYSGWTGKLICEYQPWFSANPNGHVNIGYDENNLATVAKQDTKMITRGCNINLIDFYGTKDANQQFNLNTTNLIYSDLVGRTNYPLKFAVLEDVGAFRSDCSGLSETATVTCIESALESDMDYVNNNYAGGSAHPGVYWKDGGQYVIGFFGGCGSFSALSCPNDWNTIWNAVQNYVNTKSYNFKFIFQFGSFSSPSITAGEYAWPQPASNFTQQPQQQFWWCDPTGITCNGHSNGYLDNFYYQGSQNPGKLTIGLLYAGFDDSNASWGKDRVIAQQCGHVLLDTANEVTAGGYWGKSNQIPYMMLATWNDYEEGTELESGMDNCYTAVNLSLSGSVISWSLTVAQGQEAYAAVDTIHHYALWTEPPGGTDLKLRKQIPRDASSWDLSTLVLPSGTYDVYIEMVGQPAVQNRISNSATYTQP